jgi:diaminohydroxyphosphoribosylaminopyrimidine deaminase/5-amino-6-(5-phosphoribosylamino)uracil reductase
MGDKQFMQRALDLAIKGLGGVSPNPMVGCVIVHEGQIIGEGWHKYFGEAHAEVNAIASISNKNLISDSTVYITLEPCSFHGKTPACTDLLIKYKPRAVVIASKDPNPKVSGNGIKILKQAGFEVRSGVLEKEAIAINKRFFVNMNLKRPYIVLKWAQTNDGFIARKNYDSKWISNEHSRQLVHKWRTEEDAILVGRKTVKYDNPELTARSWKGRNPIRIVIDPELKLDDSFKLFMDDDPVYIFNLVKNQNDGNRILLKVSKENILNDILSLLYTKDIGSVLVEGGAQVLNSFINEGLWDEARIFTSNNNFDEGIDAPVIEFDQAEEQNIVGDRLSIIYNPKTQTLWQRN